VLLFLPRGLPAWALLTLGQGALLCRVFAPTLDTRGRMLVSGLGVACCLLFFPAVLHRKASQRPSRGAGTSLAGLQWTHRAARAPPSLACSGLAGWRWPSCCRSCSVRWDRGSICLRTFTRLWDGGWSRWPAPCCSSSCGRGEGSSYLLRMERPRDGAESSVPGGRSSLLRAWSDREMASVEAPGGSPVCAWGSPVWP
jgi:hypothetical protein